MKLVFKKLYSPSPDHGYLSPPDMVVSETESQNMYEKMI